MAIQQGRPQHNVIIGEEVTFIPMPPNRGKKSVAVDIQFPNSNSTNGTNDDNNDPI
jgi:hypothetical protein